MADVRINFFVFLLIFTHASFAFSQSYDELRKIVVAEILGVSPQGVKIKNGIGKVDASSEFKMSYFIQSEVNANPASKMYIIPMATSRYDKYNYHTDDWWDKYGADAAAGKSVPPEDPEEVSDFLDKNGLSTNPDVYIVEDLEKKSFKKLKLQDFLANEYIKKYSVFEDVYIFRGAAKSSEVDEWRNAKGVYGMYPRGVRYWTPDVTYAWRYARKRDTFLADSLAGNSPLLQFRVPKTEFMHMVQKGQLILGTELPKSVHSGFENTGRFVDVIFPDKEYLGEGRFGVEYEIRANRTARNMMSKYFEGPITFKTLYRLRELQIENAASRIVRNEPNRSAEIIEWVQKKQKTLKLEFEIAEASQGKNLNKLKDLLLQLDSKDMFNVDFENIQVVAKKIAESQDKIGVMAPSVPPIDCTKKIGSSLLF